MPKPATDIDELKRSLSIVDVIGRSVELKKEGREYLGLCPFHGEKTPSFSVVPAKGFYHCFGCGAHGDAIDFIVELNNIDRNASGWLSKVKALVGVEGSATLTPIRPAPPAPVWRPLVPVPDDAPELIGEDGVTVEIVNPKRAGTPKEFTRLRPVDWYAYRLADGGLIGYVLRCEPKGGGKFTPQITYCVGPDGAEGWAMVSLPEPRPLLGLDDLARRGGAPVVVVEGEKAWAAARDMMPNYVAVTWPGGTAAAGRASWSALASRKVLVWPDADPAGLDAARAIVGALEAVGCTVRIINTEGLPKGWDAADAAELEDFQLGQFIKDRAQKPEVAPPPDEAPGEEGKDPEAVPVDGGLEGPQFRCLGYDSGYYYAMPYASRQVSAVPVGALTSRSQLIHLAPLDWWGYRFGDKNGKPQWDAAANAFARWCERVGAFDPSRIRGRGAWFDEGRAVLHLGDHLIVDSERVEIEGFESRYIYEAKAPIEDDRHAVEPATAEEATEIYNVFQKLNWSSPVFGALLAGWCTLAPICGALAWRPHVWLTGRRGSGKSWLIDQIVRPVVGEGAVIVQATSTEAGVRQKMKQDARPVLFDEAEAENKQDARRIQSVIELARQASSESSAEIAKGTVHGHGLSFRTRSMFLMGSINVPLTQAADRSRFTVLSLVAAAYGRAGAQQFEQLQAEVEEHITPAKTRAVRARIYRMIPTIRENAKRFARAAAEVLGSQRAGDQLGALLAGAYALRSDEVVSIEAARTWIAAQSWDEQVEAEEASDEGSLLDEILSAQIRIEGNPGYSGGPQYLQRAVGELVAVAAGLELERDVSGNIANDALGRHGLRVLDHQLMISTTHSELRRILANTPWGAGWSRVLERLPQATVGASVRFAGVRQRAVGIPVNTLPVGPAMGDEDE